MLAGVYFHWSLLLVAHNAGVVRHHLRTRTVDSRQQYCKIEPFVLFAVCLRMQLDTSNQDFKSLAPERAYADFILAHLVLLLVAWNFIG